MSSEGRKLADIVLEYSNQEAESKHDGKYYPRASAVSRCPRDMTFHRYGEPWSDVPKAMWGTQFRFDLGHDTEDRMIAAMEKAGISVQCQQMTVETPTPGGLKVLGHMDGIIVVPHEYPHGGHWYIMDVKSAGPYMYKKVFDEDISNPKEEHVMQVSVYADGIINDSNYSELNGVRVRDLNVDGYEFGGGMIVYMAIDRPKTGYGSKAIELPKIHFCQFDIESYETEEYLKVYDEVEKHYADGTVPGIPDDGDPVLWGGVRCSSRWCNRYSVCKGLVEPENERLKEVLNG